jgi:multiple sugar transport system ATP-binding protein
MASVAFHAVSKTYAGGVQALHDLNLAISDGELLVMVGPSGCGKTTALRMLAGLEEITAGEIRINEQNINRLSPQQRNVAMVFQNYALYPHMSVRGNLEFPLKMAKTGRKERQRRLQQAAELLGLTSLLERKPAQLSGGQRQRVAMGRALVRDPSVFLMDEPLSNLDAGLRLQIRAEIASLQRETGTTTLYVTHDQVEAMTLGKRVAVLDRGRLQQVDTPQLLYQRPANVFVADFLGSPGMNFFATRLLHDAQNNLCIGFNGEAVPIPPAARQDLAELRGHEDAPQGVIGGLRPEAFALSPQGGHQRPLPVRVTAVEPLGHETLLYFNSPLRAITAAALPLAQTPDSDAGDIAMVARLPGNLNYCGDAVSELFADIGKLQLFNRQGRRL